MAHYRLTLVVSIAALAGACDGIGEVCTLELGARFTPADTAIQVGQSFQPSVQLSSCGGKQQLNDVISWHAEDPAVASVDGRSGRVAGQAVGTTRILASGAHYGSVGGLQVAVRAAAP